MGLITGTNIVVDQFSFGKNTPWIRYIYFLTHYHSDHYQGLTSAFSYGKVYCSELTKPLITNKFKNIPDIEGLEINKTHTIYLDEEKTLSVEVTMLDANHVPGSVIILFKGYMGTILHTGDFRFHPSMIYNYPLLYPPEKRTNDLTKCSIHIDELIYDNTFCDPIFVFPSREKAVMDTIQIIEKHKGKKFLLMIYTWGKEELLVLLAEYFKTKIVVDADRYKNIKDINFRPELFTTDENEGFLYVLRDIEARDQLENKNLIRIRLTGWVNAETFSSADAKTYYVPYSSHSNFKEIEMFVKSIHPCLLRTVVREHNTSQKIYRINTFSSYMNTLTHLQPRGHSVFVKEYTKPAALSPEYKKWQNYREKHELEKKLGLKKTPEEIKAFLDEFEEKNPRLHANYVRRSEGKGNWQRPQKKKVQVNKNAKNEKRSIVKVKGIKDPKQMAKSRTLDSMFTSSPGSKKLTFSERERSNSLQAEPQSVLSESSTNTEDEEINEIEEYKEEELNGYQEEEFAEEEEEELNEKEKGDNYEMEGETIERMLSNLSNEESKKDTPNQNSAHLRRSDQSLFPDLSDDVLRKKVFTELDRIKRNDS